MDAIAFRANSAEIRRLQLFIWLLVARWITEWTEGTTKKQAWRRSRSVFFLKTYTEEKANPITRCMKPAYQPGYYTENSCGYVKPS